MPPDTATDTATERSSAIAASPTSGAARPIKPWWRSKVLWFNLVCALLGAAELSMGLLQAVLPVNAYAALAFMLAVGNAGLRVVTTQALGRGTAAPGA